MTSLSRRTLLTRGVGALGAASLSAWPALASDDDGRDDTTLVLLELRGGNDGLNTVVPFADDAYHALRKHTRIKPADVRRIDDYRGFHPALGALSRRYAEGGVAVLQGVGYPNGNLSHFKSLEIWHTADLRGRNGADGWVGRLASTTWPKDTLPERTVHIGPETPYSLSSVTHPPVAFHSPDTYRWLGDRDAESFLGDRGLESGRGVLDRVRGVMRDARSSSRRILRSVRRYETRVEYPGTAIARTLRDAAALISSGLGSRVISVRYGSFDTHANQAYDQNDLFRKLDPALDAFLTDLGRTQAGRKTLVLAYSEFGRRARENGSGGTDHGKAGVMFALGAPVEGGLYGEYPSLTDLDQNDLRFGLDFRSAYATAIRHLGGSSELVLGQGFEPVPFA